MEIPERTAGQSEYTMGYSEEFLRLLHRRSPESDASHLLPPLKPGLSALDLGCGPGTITVGLARAVEPGEVHGIDIEDSQIEMARAAAADGGLATQEQFDGWKHALKGVRENPGTVGGLAFGECIATSP